MGYPIPDDALDDRLAWIGNSGSGKTYNAGTAVERLLTSGARAVICDPLGVWHGLRLSADGKNAAFPVVIFGGPHGDLPLTEQIGALIGEAAATMAESCIVDLSDIETAAGERRFMLGFLRALYHKSTGQTLHLVLDEADMWAPQTIRDKEGDSTKLFAITERIVRRARVDGFISWMITQRPAEISKSVLSMVDGLVAMRLTSPQDRTALDAWISGQVDKAEGQRIKDAMPTLQQGEGIVWLPKRGVLETARFPTKVTFDSSRAPKRGETRKAVELKPLDLGALKEKLATVEAETKANDPRALKAEITKLRAELNKRATAAPPQPGYSRQEIEDAERAGFLRGVEEGERRGNSVGQSVMLARARSALDGLRVDDAPSEGSPPRPALRPAPAPARPKSEPIAARAPRPSEDGVPPGCAKPLAALAGVYPAGMTEAQWATAAGYKRSGGTWGTYKSRLRGAGLIYQQDGRWFASELGAEAVGEVELPPAPGPDLVRWWASRLPGTTKIAEALIEAWPRELARDELAAAVSMSAAGGSFGTYLSRLASPGIIEREGGVIRLSAEAMGDPSLLEARG